MTILPDPLVPADDKKARVKLPWRRPHCLKLFKFCIIVYDDTRKLNGQHEQSFGFFGMIFLILLSIIDALGADNCLPEEHFFTFSIF